MYNYNTELEYCVSLSYVCMYIYATLVCLFVCSFVCSCAHLSELFICCLQVKQLQSSGAGSSSGE